MSKPDADRMTHQLSRILALVLIGSACALCQAVPKSIARILNRPVQQPDVVEHELRQYLLQRVPSVAPPASASEWNAQAQRLRSRILSDIVYHGWPKEWVDAALNVQDMGSIPSGPGYRMRKLRIEVVPGFWTVAILYEPVAMHGKIPGILNVNGHVGLDGKAVEYKQKRCINQAKSGILALSLEWIGMGEMSHKENKHSFASQLDLVGANSVGLFYLAMRKGLDFLYQHPNIDRERLGMTGLSGGGWQTIVLSSLDERVKVSVPVAGSDRFSRACLGWTYPISNRAPLTLWLQRTMQRWLRCGHLARLSWSTTPRMIAAFGPRW